MGRQAGQRRGISGGLEVASFGQDTGDLVPVQVQGRGREVGGGMADQLDDELPQIGFGETNALI